MGKGKTEGWGRKQGQYWIFTSSSPVGMVGVLGEEGFVDVLFFCLLSDDRDDGEVDMGMDD